MLNGHVAQPLQLRADGSLPPMPAAFCGKEEEEGGSGGGEGPEGTTGGGGACAEVVTLPPQSWAFLVLLGARASACEF